MNTTSIAKAISRIERAPNVSRLVDAYDAAIPDSIVSVHRMRGTEWQVWHGEMSGFVGSFSEVRSHLAEDAEEILDRAAAEEIASEPAMVPQQAQQQQACAAPRVAMRLQRTVTTHGIVAIDATSVGPCPEFPDHGRDEYRVTPTGVVRTRYVLASDHRNWSCPGARPFITPNRSRVTAQRTIDAVCECLAAPAMVPQQAQQQQARDMRAGRPDPRAAAAARLPVWSDGWLDEELLAILGPIVEEISDEMALSKDDEISAAAQKALAATREWQSLCEREANGESIGYDTRFDARTRMQYYHRVYADIQDIKEIGKVGLSLTLHSAWDGLAVFEDGDTEPMLTLPRGIEPWMARLIVLTHRRAYIAGKDAGIDQAQAEMRRALGMPA